MQYETGTTSHLDRMAMTNRLCEMLEHFWGEHDMMFMEYGQNIIIEGNGSLQARWKKTDVKTSSVIKMTKFSPDYFLYHPASKSLFMADAKVSTTPMFFDSAIARLRMQASDLSLNWHRIGEVEREAFDNYTERFPPQKVAIILAAPYSPVLVHAEWASNLTPFYRFEADLNEQAGGSGTPHVNVDLAKMRSLGQFFQEEFGIQVDEEMLQDIMSEVKLWPLNKPQGRVNWAQFNNAILNMGVCCPWLEGRIPSDNAYVENFKKKFERARMTLHVFPPIPKKEKPPDGDNAEKRKRGRPATTASPVVTSNPAPPTADKPKPRVLGRFQKKTDS